MLRKATATRLTPMPLGRDHVADATGVVGLPRRSEMPERDQFCGDCSQATAQAQQLKIVAEIERGCGDSTGATKTLRTIAQTQLVHLGDRGRLMRMLGAFQKPDGSVPRHDAYADGTRLGSTRLVFGKAKMATMLTRVVAVTHQAGEFGSPVAPMR
jgi:hypothetical protein